MINPSCLLRRLSILRRFGACESGVTAMEFALVSPIFFTLFLGTLEISLIMLGQSIMESATASVSREGKTGYVEEGATREETIMAELSRYNSPLIDVSQVSITALAYEKFSDIGQPEPYVDVNSNGIFDEGEPYEDMNGNQEYDADQGKPGYGDDEDIVVYTLTYAWHVITPIIGKAITGDVHVMNARVVVKNEPYNVDWQLNDEVVATDESGGEDNNADANGGIVNGGGSCDPINNPGACQ